MNQPDKLRIELPLVLPDIDDVGDGCVRRLISRLTGRPGISEAHVISAADGGVAQLCIHYDRNIVSLGRVRELAQAAGADLSDRYAHLVIKSAGPLHPRAARRVADGLRDVPGVMEADVSGAGVVRVEFDREQVSEQVVRSKAAALGFRPASPDPGAAVPVPQPLPADAAHAAGEHDHDRPGHAHDHDHAEGRDDHASHDHPHGGPLGEKSELIFAVLAGLLLGAGWLIERLSAGPAWLPTVCYLSAYAFGGYFTTREAIDNLRARRFEIDTLMLVAAVGAAALGKWAEGALLLFLFSLGHSLEHYAMGRARKAIEALAKLAPDTATVRRESGTAEVGVAELQIGDVVIVRPNERLPADGVVVVGTSSVNQAPVTGESVPVDKRPAAMRGRPWRPSTVSGPNTGCSPARSTALARSRSWPRGARINRRWRAWSRW